MGRFRYGFPMSESFLDKVPASLTILGNETPINIIKMKNFGEFCYNREEIDLQVGVRDDLAKKTLIHEIVHAALAFSGHHEEIDEKKEEALCRMFENTFFPLVNFKFE